MVTLKSRRHQRDLLVTSGLMVVLVFGCGKKKDAEEETPEPAQGTAITMTGSINVTSTTTAELFDASEVSAHLIEPQSADAATLATYKLVCTVLGGSGEVVTGTVDIDGSGGFSISIAAASSAMACAVLSGETQIASFIFKNPSQTGFDGSAKKESRIRPIGNIDFGALAANGDAGTVEIDTSKFAGKFSSKTFESPWDLTGKWQFVKTANVPAGYITPCTAAERKAAEKAGKDSECRGPEEGEVVWMKRVNGTSVATGAKNYGIMVWTNEDAFNACGAKLGFDYATGKSKAGIDFSASGVSEGNFTWTAGWDDGWKNTIAATVSYPMQDCVPSTYKDVPVFKCTDEAGRYNIGVQGGCVDSKGKGVQIEGGDWNSLFTNVSNTQSTDSKTGLKKNTMTATYKSQAITCVHVGGSFNADGTEYSGGVTPRVFAAKGALCSSIPETSDAAKLNKLRCYANYFYEKGEKERGNGICLRRIQTDWTASDPAKFLVGDDGPKKARNEHVLTLLNYTDENTGTFHDEDTYYKGVNINGQWVGCLIRDAFTITMRKVDDSNAEGEFVSETTLVDKGKAACASITDSVSKTFLKMKKI